MVIPTASSMPTEPALPPSTPKRAPDIVERVAIVGVQPGDVIVFESREDATDQQIDQLARRIQEVLGDQTLSVVINGKLGGVLRREGSELVETTPFNTARRRYLIGGKPS
ncbi:hypothetical protein [Lentzea sp. NPDC092896]|uniref:hypothetical protein n=1 Tax=Lentzea sp. NPDC092896 TaxID=3364127 RepID=UPI003807A487